MEKKIDKDEPKKPNTMTAKEFNEAVEKSPHLKKALKGLNKAVDKEFKD